jgi:hypothetical protein
VLEQLGIQEVENIQNSGGRGVVSRSSLWKSVLAWRCRLFDCRDVTTCSTVGIESGPSGIMTVWPPALMIWSIQASTVPFSSECECMWANKMVVVSSHCSVLLSVVGV